jgi:hypothetical protein
MPTPLEQSLSIILGPDSKLRDKTPIIYALPKAMPEGWTDLNRMRYLDHDISGGRNVKSWLRNEYGSLVLQQPPFEECEDQSEIFTTIREPLERWWSGIRDFMHMLPYYSWWENEKIMEQWPHFHRATLRIHDIMEQIKPQHLIKVDDTLGDRMVRFAKRHRLLCYGAFPHLRHIRHSRNDIQVMEKKGRKQLEQWLAKNPSRQKQLDEYLEPDYVYWNKVKHQD